MSKKEEKDSKDKELKDLRGKKPLEQLNAVFKNYKLDELQGPTEEDFNIPRIPSGYAEIDAIINGGYPIGAIVVIWGPEKSGKSSLAIKALAEAQRMGKKGLYYDLERGVNKTFSTSLGLNLTDGSVIIRPQTSGDVAETVIDVICDVIKKTDIDVIVLDSVTALVPKDVQEGSAEDVTVGLVARLLSQNLGKIAGLVGEYKKTLFIISQEREVIGVRLKVGQPPKTTMTGGKSLKFYNSLTLYARPRYISKTDRPDMFEGDIQIGHPLVVTVQKSRVSLPNGVAEVDFFYKPIRRILGLLKSNYGESYAIKRNKTNHAKFEYTDNSDNVYKGVLSAKQDWEELFVWFKENGLLFDFLEKINEANEEFIKVLLNDGDIDEQMFQRWLNDNTGI